MSDYSYDEIEMRRLAKKHEIAVEVHESPIGGRPAYNLTRDGKSICSGHFYKVLDFLEKLDKKQES